MAFKDKPFITAFTDIETVPQALRLDEVDDKAQSLFIKRFEQAWAKDPQYQNLLPEIQASAYYWDKASFYAEFAQVCAVSTGYLVDGKFKIKTLFGRDEAQLLRELANIYINCGSLVAHNGKDFDFPFLTRRFLINGIPVPPVLNTAGKKPWEVQLQDTMEMWSGTQWKYRCGLDLICHCLGLPSPKQDIDGSQVRDLYYSGKDGDLERIATYCEGDILALANVYYRIKGQNVIRKDQIVRA